MCLKVKTPFLIEIFFALQDVYNHIQDYIILNDYNNGKMIHNLMIKLKIEWYMNRGYYLLCKVKK